MFLLDWYRQLIDIKSSRECESCDTLRMQLAIANDNNRRLMDRILDVPVVEKEVDTTNLKPISGPLSWHARRQMLEAEDRAKAKVLKANESIITAKTTIEELENEVLGDKENAVG